MSFVRCSLLQLILKDISEMNRLVRPIAPIDRTIVKDLVSLYVLMITESSHVLAHSLLSVIFKSPLMMISGEQCSDFGVTR